MPKRGHASLEGFNPISDWEEQVEVEGLTLWDLNRPVWTVKEKTAGETAGSSSGDGHNDTDKDLKEAQDTVDVAILHSDIKVSLGVFHARSGALIADRSWNIYD